MKKLIFIYLCLLGLGITPMYLFPSLFSNSLVFALYVILVLKYGNLYLAMKWSVDWEFYQEQKEWKKLNVIA